MTDDLLPGGLLAIDPSSTIIGWAYGHTSEKNPAFGRWVLSKLGTEGMIYRAVSDQIYAALKILRPSAVVMESPLPPEAQDQTITALKLYGVRALILEAVARQGIRSPTSVDADSVRLDVIGRCRWPKKGQGKDEVVAFCLRRGLRVPDHNAGDAVVLWLWKKRREHGLPQMRGPLFGEEIMPVDGYIPSAGLETRVEMGQYATARRRVNPAGG